MLTEDVCGGGLCVCEVVVLTVTVTEWVVLPRWVQAVTQYRTMGGSEWLRGVRWYRTNEGASALAQVAVAVAVTQKSPKSHPKAH